MANGVIGDNWSLQDISSLFMNGFEEELASEVVVSDKVHSYKPVSYAAIQTEALFDLITDLILRDEILVDKEYISAWNEERSPILQASELGVIRDFSFLDDYKKLEGPRESIVNYLCSTEPLRKAHEANVAGWKNKRETPDPVLSGTLWGGAGMCARSYVYEKSYTPHPLRKRLFVNSGFLLPAQDALHQVTTFINDNRINVSKKIYGNDSLYSLALTIPSLPVRVIQESSSAEQIISVALEMRDEFLQLRDWLKDFQNAMGNEDTKILLNKRKELDSVSNYVNARLGMKTEKSPISMEIGVSIFKLTVDLGKVVDCVGNQFGIRAMLNKLIFGPSGKQELRKFVKMFDAEKTSVGYQVESYFSQGG